MNWAYVGFVIDSMTMLPHLITELLERALTDRSSLVTRGPLVSAPFTGAENVNCDTFETFYVSGRYENSCTKR